ncbi:hypothetical protein BpHYR1_035629 [Brachionus plicatilis]|uniref:Uncharacterized protein n=1 Tax=Brachionus plicatilis TaxID=10195 RepID=A0A3M7RQE3_BRAPC|nr:hypothetical protein BpHYR1_035629 [Brachionus plicatilis]
MLIVSEKCRSYVTKNTLKTDRITYHEISCEKQLSKKKTKTIEKNVNYFEQLEDYQVLKRLVKTIFTNFININFLPSCANHSNSSLYYSSL